MFLNDFTCRVEKSTLHFLFKNILTEFEISCSKTEFFRIFHEIRSEFGLFIFSGPLIRIIGGILVERVYNIGDFDKNTKNGQNDPY